MVSDFIWHWWLPIILASSRSQKTASKKLKCKREEFFLKMTKNLSEMSKKKHLEFIKNFKCKRTSLLDAFERSRKKLSCNILLVDESSVVRELSPKKRRICFCGPWKGTPEPYGPAITSLRICFSIDTVGLLNTARFQNIKSQDQGIFRKPRSTILSHSSANVSVQRQATRYL